MKLERSLWLLFASMLLWGLGSGLYMYTWPVYVTELGGGAPEIGLLQAISFAVMALSYLPGGYLTDRFDRKWIMVVGWAVAVPAPLLYAFARHWTHLLPGIVLYNVSMFSNSAVRAYMAHLAPPERLSSVFAVLDMAWPVGLIASPSIGGLWAQQAGMRPVFFGSFVLYLASTLVLLGLRSQKVVGDFQSLGDFRRILWVPRMPKLLVLGAGMYLVQFLAIPFSTPFLRDVGGLDLAEIGFLGSVISLGGVVLSPVLGYFSDRVGRERGLAASLGLLGISFLTLVATPSFGGLILSMLLRGVAGVSWSLFAAIAAIATPPDMRGRGFAVVSLVTAIAQTIAPYPGGLMYARNPSLPFVLSAISLFVLAGVVLLDDARWRRETSCAAKIPDE
ncbi:MAG TPA: MFS transporter [Firmicutes bacterium]|nr:MFS transporter [Candidatus Fermentithermobacillaceae bacterium]